MPNETRGTKDITNQIDIRVVNKKKGEAILKHKKNQVERMNEMERNKQSQNQFGKNWGDLNYEEKENIKIDESWVCENCSAIQLAHTDDDGGIVMGCMTCGDGIFQKSEDEMQTERKEHLN